ncbi:MAG: HU family DNA-binding protein [Syntrophobacteraceae bacterium]
MRILGGSNHPGKAASGLACWSLSSVSGFARFSVKEKHQLIAGNPQTGEPVTLPPGKVVTFKYSRVLRAAINSESD